MRQSNVPQGTPEGSRRFTMSQGYIRSANLPPSHPISDFYLPSTANTKSSLDNRLRIHGRRSRQQFRTSGSTNMPLSFQLMSSYIPSQSQEGNPHPAVSPSFLSHLAVEQPKATQSRLYYSQKNHNRKLLHLPVRKTPRLSICTYSSLQLLFTS